MRIVILGAGSVGTNLHHAFSLKGIKTELIHARPLTNPTGEAGLTAAGGPTGEAGLTAAGGLSATRSGSDLEAVRLPLADIYIYAIADQALREVVSKIHAPKALHLHTSGTMPIEVFGEDKPHSGILYFFQSFSRDVMIDDWSGIPCFVEGKSIDVWRTISRRSIRWRRPLRAASTKRTSMTASGCI